MSDKHEHGFIGTLKHLAFEDEPDKTTAAAAQPAPAATLAAMPAAAFSVAVPSPAIYVPPQSDSSTVGAGTIADSDETYQRLLSRTDFESTDVAKAIHHFLDPLKTIPDAAMPPNMKFKSAVLQASANSGLTADSILAAFDLLKATLSHEQDAFSKKATEFTAREITAKQDRIAAITSQIVELQTEMATLSGQVVEAQGKATHAQSQFAAAVQRRMIELDQQRAQYEELLKG